MRDETVPLAALARIAIHAQGYVTRRRAATKADVEAVVRRLSCVQLDSIATVARSHKLALASRVGRLPKDAEWDLMREGRVFEYWAHEASLLHADDHVLFRRRMRDRSVHHWWGPVLASDPALARRVLRVVRKKGPVRSDDFAGRNTGMWGLKPEKRMLDALWTAGKLAVAGREGFVRLYDLPERVLPERVLDAKPPSPRANLDALLQRAVHARGVLTAQGARDHFRLDETTAQVGTRLRALAGRGDLQRLHVGDGGKDAYAPSDADLDPPEPRGAVLLTPFDNLLWDRHFARRALGFDHLIEVYKPQPQRRFGYYVMPLLVDGRIVGRADLKADRDAGRLLHKAMHWEGRPTARAREGFEEAFDRLAWTLGLER